MKNYNGKYDHQVSVIISSSDHNLTLESSKRIKMLCEAWNKGISFTEHKSARSGDILTREIQIRQIDYAGTVIAFREALRCICFDMDTLTDASVKVVDRGTIPDGARSSLAQ